MTDKDKYIEELKAALREDQLASDDQTVYDTLDGVYDDIEEDELESLMDAEEDSEDESEAPDADVELARGIAQECEGVDDEGNPRSAISFSLATYQPDIETTKTLVEYAAYRPVVHIGKRYEFIEIRLEFPVAGDNDMKVIWAHLERFGTMLDCMTEPTLEVPIVTMCFVPIGGVGSYFMSANNPIIWNMQPKRPGGSVDCISLLFHCDDVAFYSTDEMDINSLSAAALRAVEENAEYRYDIDEREQNAREEAAKANERIEALRRKTQI